MLFFITSKKVTRFPSSITKRSMNKMLNSLIIYLVNMKKPLLRKYKISKRKSNLRVSHNIYEKGLFCLFSFISILSCGCKQIKISLPNPEQDNVIQSAISIENDSSFGLINGAKYGSHYLLDDRFHDSLFLDNNI